MNQTQLITERTFTYKEGRHFNASLWNVRCTEPHFHPHDLELVYCLEGSVTLISGEQVFHLEAGSLYSVDDEDVHFLYSDVANLTLIFHIDMTRLGTPWEQLRYRLFTCETTHCYPYQKEPMARLKDILLALSAVQFASADQSPLYDTGPSVNRMADLLCRYFDWFNYNNQDEYMNPDLHARFYDTFAYCMDHYREKLTAADLAQREHITSNYFSQFLSTTVFSSFGNMVKYIRCFRAEKLLLQTGLPNYEISYAVGFSDPKYFYAAFEYWWHRSPRAHRQLYRDHAARFAKAGNASEHITGPTARALIEKHICNWHLEKAL